MADGWKANALVNVPRPVKREIIGNECTSILRTTVPPVHCQIGSDVVATSGWLQTNALRLSVDVNCTYPKSCKEDSHICQYLGLTLKICLLMLLSLTSKMIKKMV